MSKIMLNDDDDDTTTTTTTTTTTIFPMALRPNAGHGLLILEVYRSHTTTHHRR